MADVIVRVRDHGPIVIEGPIQLVDAAGNRYAIDPGKPAIALCRCGASGNKPYCDGSHKSCGFAAADRAPAQA